MNAPEARSLPIIKDEIRIEAEGLRARTPHPTLPKAYPRPRRRIDNERQRLDYTIDELCRFPYTTFVDQAFRAVLKRPPDPAGFDAHVRLLISGGSKIEVLGNLRYSGEGRAIGARIPGLLPRYALAKAFRIPVIGYAIEWLVALAGLPKIVQQQRASDIVHFSRSYEIDAIVRTLKVEVGTLGDTSDRLSEQALVSHAHISSQLSSLQHGLRRELDELEARTRAPHAVLSLNHWMTELRRSIALVEEEEQSQRDRAAKLASGIMHRLHPARERAEHRLSWLSALVSRVPSGSRVLDIGSGVDWEQQLAAAGFEIVALVGDSPGSPSTKIQHLPQTPMVVLERAADASMDVLSALAAGALMRRVPAASLMPSARRILKPGGWFVLALELGDSELADRLGGRAAPSVDADLLEVALAASGFTDVARISEGGGAPCLFARNPA